LSPNVDNSGIPNNMTPFGIRYQLEFGSIPTIINGITASTSIIIGFTGAMVALFYKIFENDDNTKAVLLISAFYEIVPLVFLLFVYDLLPLGYIDVALKLAFIAFGLSLLSLATVMLGSLYRLVRKKKNPITPRPTATSQQQANTPPTTPPSEPQVKTEEQTKDGNKTVNITINM
jgi:hypothetical protein